MTPRYQPIVARLNSTEVAILGGFDVIEFQGDAVVFNTVSNACEKVIASADFRFIAKGN